MKRVSVPCIVGDKCGHLRSGLDYMELDGKKVPIPEYAGILVDDNATSNEIWDAIDKKANEDELKHKINKIAKEMK